MNIETTKIFNKNRLAKTRYVINQGGTRSGKTFGLMQLAYVVAIENPNSIISIVSETMPHLKRGAMRDFFHFLQVNNLYRPSDHNKTDNAYKVGTSLIEFFSCDSPDKVHGPGRDFLFVNEIQNIQYETFFHLAQRTNIRIYADYNPTHEFWIYSEFLENKQYESDITFIHSTIFDNPFISEAIKKDVLLRADRDENYKKVYLEGQKGSLEGLIYPKYSVVEEMPNNLQNDGYGLDFGFTHPTAMVRCGVIDNALYIDEILYQEGLTGAQLVNELGKLKIKKNYDEIFADLARPEIIEEIFRAGYNIKGATKGDGSVNYGIDLVKRFDIFITKRSVNTIKEIRNYRWQTDKNGKATDKPFKALDDALDSVRYWAVMNAEINKIQTFGFSMIGHESATDKHIESFNNFRKDA